MTMNFLTEDVLPFIPFIVCFAVLLVAGVIYLIVQHFKDK